MLVEQIPAVSYLGEVDGPDEGIYVSPQIRDLLGFEPEDWYGEPQFWRRHLHREDEPEVWAAWRRCVELGGVFASEYRMVAKDGRVVWVSDRSTISPSDDGRPRWIQGVLIDITKLRAAEERFRTVFEASPIGIMVIGKDLRIVDASPAFCRLLGLARDEAASMSVFDVTHPDDIAAGRDLWNRVFTGEIPSFSVEKRYLGKDGSTIWVTLTGSGVHDEPPRATYGIGMVEDIRERKRAEAEMLEAAAEANRRLAEFSPREREALDLAAQGLSARQIAAGLHISARTVESHLASVYRKLGVTSKEAAIAEYHRLTSQALTTPPDDRLRTENP